MRVQGEVQASQDTIHLFDSVQAKVKEVCAEEGATLNEFVNVAVAERLARYEEMQWLKRHRIPTEASIRNAREILSRAGDVVPDPGDEVPNEWVYPEGHSRSVQP